MTEDLKTTLPPDQYAMDIVEEDGELVAVKLVPLPLVEAEAETTPSGGSLLTLDIKHDDDGTIVIRMLEVDRG